MSEFAHAIATTAQPWSGPALHGNVLFASESLADAAATARALTSTMACALTGNVPILLNFGGTAQKRTPREEAPEG